MEIPVEEFASIEDDTILARLRQEGECEFAAGHRCSMGRSHPVRFATLTLERIAYFWFPLDRTNKRALVNGIVMSLVTGPSFFSVLLRRSPGFAILAGELTCYPLAYYLVQVEQRYRQFLGCVSCTLRIRNSGRRFTSS